MTKSTSWRKEILGTSPLIKKMLDLIGKVGPTKTSVLIIGESGTGKELVARMLHDLSPAKDRAFIPVNCGAIPETLIESEMFGHKRGSFTGAVGDKPGLFEAAQGGTLFLDEVGELPLSMQVKLLRALQERTIRPVGGNDDVKVDVRIIAATNRDLEEAIKKGTFREDLYYRLNVILIKSPALRDRREDILPLARFFLKQFSEEQHKNIADFSKEAIERIEGYSWPGNVRELENVIERVVTFESGDQIGVENFPASLQASSEVEQKVEVASVAVKSPSDKNMSDIELGLLNVLRSVTVDFSRGPIDVERVLIAFEKRLLEEALHYTRGVKTKAAELLKVTFRSFRYRLKKVGLGSDDDSTSE